MALEVYNLYNGLGNLGFLDVLLLSKMHDGSYSGGSFGPAGSYSGGSFGPAGSFSSWIASLTDCFCDFQSTTTYEYLNQ